MKPARIIDSNAIRIKHIWKSLLYDDYLMIN